MGGRDRESGLWGRRVRGGFSGFFDALIEVENDFAEGLFVLGHHGMEEVEEAFGRGEAHDDAAFDFDGFIEDPPIDVRIEGEVENDFLGSHDAPAHIRVESLCVGDFDGLFGSGIGGLCHFDGCLWLEA